MPEGTVYVGRPAAWGNPFDWMEFGRETAVALYRNALIGHWNPSLLDDRSDVVFGWAYLLHTEWRRRMGKRSEADELRGLNLACWCRLDEPCHADVLLELANR